MLKGKFWLISAVGLWVEGGEIGGLDFRAPAARTPYCTLIQEVEIVRMAINSTTFGVTSVYARRGKSRIYYRVVDEYGGDTLSGPSTRSSIKPLNLGQLVEFFDRAWPLMEVLEMNFEGDIDGMLGFFRAESVFSPQIDALYRIRVRETVTLSEQAMTEYPGK